MESRVLDIAARPKAHAPPPPKGRGHRFEFADVFAGIGGFHQAMKPLGGKCVAACEIDKRARETYLANHSVPKGRFYKDINSLDFSLFPAHDLLCAGFPCQPFSISGKHKALKDKRSGVIDSLFALIKAKRPKMVMLENVKHLRHVSGGRAFEHVIDSLQNLGYKVSCKLLNARDFGVPQNRERWIFVGVAGGERFPFHVRASPPVFLRDVLDSDGDFFYLDEPFTVIENPKTQRSGLIFCGYRNKRQRSRGTGNSGPRLSRVHNQTNRIYSIEGVHPTIPSQETAGRFWVMLENGRVRKLSIAECFRLMGFDDSFRKPVAGGCLYKQIGNSVCVPMIQEVSRALLGHMGY